MANALTTFTFRSNESEGCYLSHSIRVVTLDGNPWFVGMDVCACLDLKANPANRSIVHHFRKLDDSEFRNVAGVDATHPKRSYGAVSEKADHAERQARGQAVPRLGHLGGAAGDPQGRHVRGRRGRVHASSKISIKSNGWN